VQTAARLLRELKRQSMVRFARVLHPRRVFVVAARVG
jgi:hypothetical protein